MKNPIRDPHVKKRESWLKNFVLGLTAKFNPTKTKTNLWKKMLKKKYKLS